MIIDVQNIVKTIGEKTILNNVSVSCKEKSIYGLLGSNGAGKTSLIRVMNGLFRIESGYVSILGINPMKEKEKIHKLAGVSTEETMLRPHLTVDQNLAFYAGFYPNTLSKNELSELMDQLYISEYKKTKYSALSSGNKKKVDLVRSIIHRPILVFWDEPFANLDPEGAESVIRLIKILNSQNGVTFFISSHDLVFCQAFCSHIGFLFKSKIVCEDTIQNIYERYSCDNLGDAYFKARGKII